MYVACVKILFENNTSWLACPVCCVIPSSSWFLQCFLVFALQYLKSPPLNNSSGNLFCSLWRLLQFGRKRIKNTYLIAKYSLQFSQNYYSNRLSMRCPCLAREDDICWKVDFLYGLTRYFQWSWSSWCRFSLCHDSSSFSDAIFLPLPLSSFCFS